MIQATWSRTTSSAPVSPLATREPPTVALPLNHAQAQVPVVGCTLSHRQLEVLPASRPADPSVHGDPPATCARKAKAPSLAPTSTRVSLSDSDGDRDDSVGRRQALPVSGSARAAG